MIPKKLIKEKINYDNRVLIIDFSQIAHAAFWKATSMNKLNMFHYLVLLSIKTLKEKFKPKEIILAMDSRNSWRKQTYKNYKYNRNKDADVFDYINSIQEDLMKYFSFTIFKIEEAEADDIIALYVEKTTDKEIIIISGDKDFKQLLKYDYVKIYDPKNKKIIECENPDYELQNLILSGDKIDGIPNIFSPLESIKKGKRQNPFGKTKVNEAYEKGINNFLHEYENKIQEKYDLSVKDRYDFNKKMIELNSSVIPKKIVDKFQNVENLGKGNKDLIKRYFENKKINSLKVDDYLI